MKKRLKLTIALLLFFATPLFADPNEATSIFKKQHEVLNDGMQYLTYSADIDDGRVVFIINEDDKPDSYQKQAVARYIVDKNVYRLLAINYCVDESDLCGDINLLLQPLEKVADILYSGDPQEALLWRITFVKNDNLVSTEQLVPIPTLGDLKDFVGVYSEADDEDGGAVVDENGNATIYKAHFLDWSYGPKVNP